MSANHNNSRRERMVQEYAGRMSDIRMLWDISRGEPTSYPDALLKFVNDYGLPKEATDDEIVETAQTALDEYGLWDYVAPGTFDGQRRGYFRWRISTGGPGDEFRFFVDERFGLKRVEYWFLDWFDDARRVIRRGADYDLLADIWQDVRDCDMPRYWMEQAGIEFD